MSITWHKLVWCCLGMYVVASFAEELELTLSAASEQVENGSVSIRIVCNDTSPILIQVAKALAETLKHTGQIQAQVVCLPQPHGIQEIKAHFDEEYPFALYLSANDDETSIHGKLYNTLDVVMLEGKRWSQRSNAREWAYAIAHDVWLALMGTEGSFLTSIAYIKRIEARGKRTKSVLCVSSWDGALEREIMTRPTPVLAPAWSATGAYPLFFSEFTTTNVRLMMATAQGALSIVLDRDGTTVGVSLACVQGEDQVIYCRSGKLWRYIHEVNPKRGRHQLIVDEEGTAACPQLLSTGDVVYCADGHIKYWDAQSKKSRVLTERSFATSPTVHEPTQTLVYSRRVKGTMQLYLCTLQGTNQRQITSGEGHKVDPSISPCGNYVAYCVMQGKKSEIWVLNLIIGTSHRISREHDYVMTPAWSGLKPA